MINKMRGAPWEAVPGKPRVAIPVEIQDNGDVTNGHDEDVDQIAPMDEEGSAVQGWAR